MLIIIGDWNAKVENEAESNVGRKFGLGVRNVAGNRLSDFWEVNNLHIKNICLKQL